MFKIGHGFDVHKFGEGDHIVLGGVRIPHSQGLLAHSDGDVLIHAVCDALLGAMGLGDIGRHFPDSDERFDNIDSRQLLAQVYNMLNQRGFRLNNLDATIIAQTPKMAPHIDTMQQQLAADLHSTVEQVNVKATTTEGLGYSGRKEGIAVHAVVLIESVD